MRLPKTGDLYSHFDLYYFIGNIDKVQGIKHIWVSAVSKNAQTYYKQLTIRDKFVTNIFNEEFERINDNS